MTKMRVNRNGKWVSLTGDQPSVENFSAGDSAENSSKSNTWLYIALGVIGVILVGILVWCLMKRSGSNSQTVVESFGAGDPVAQLDNLEAIMQDM